MQNDTTLIRLGPPTALPALRLVRPGDEPRWAPGTLATVAGWGNAVLNGPGSQTLQQATVPIQSDADLRIGLRVRLRAASMICAGYPAGGIDACQGTAAVPLMVPDGGTGWLEAGVVSWASPARIPGPHGLRPGGGVHRADRGDPRGRSGGPGRAAGGRHRRRDRDRSPGAPPTVSRSVTPSGLATSFRVEYGTTPAYGASTRRSTPAPAARWASRPTSPDWTRGPPTTTGWWPRARPAWRWARRHFVTGGVPAPWAGPVRPCWTRPRAVTPVPLSMPARKLLPTRVLGVVAGRGTAHVRLELGYPARSPRRSTVGCRVVSARASGASGRLPPRRMAAGTRRLALGRLALAGTGPASGSGRWTASGPSAWCAPSPSAAELGTAAGGPVRCPSVSP